MQAAIIGRLLSNKDIAEKIEKLVSETKEMNEASLDASRYKGDVSKFLENLPEDEFAKMLERMYKEIKKGYGGQDQDLENQDATADRDQHGSKNLNDVSTVEKEKQVESFGNPDQPATDVGNVGHQDLENQVADDTGGPGHNILNDELSFHHSASKGQVKQERNKPPWEFPPPQEPQSLTQRKDSRDQQLPLKSAGNDGNIEIPISSHQLDDSVSTNSSAERLTDSESDEELMSDSNSSSTGSSSANCDSHPGSTVPIQAYADNNRAISPRAIEHVQISVSGSRSGDGNSVPHDSHRSRVEDAQDQLPEQPNLQRPIARLELCNAQLTETLRNYSQVALQQANRETQNVQGTTCSNCDAMQEENDELQEQVVNLEEEFQQSQEQIAAYGPLLRDQAHQINILKQQRDQLLTQIAACEETVRAQHEDKKDDKMMIDFLIERNKKWQDEHDIANKRAGKFAQKIEKEFDALQKTMQDTMKGIEELQKKFMAEKEEKEMLKKKLKEWEERWKERNLGQGNMHQHRELRALQRRLGLRFCAGDEEGNNLDPQQDDVDEVD